MTGAAIRDFVLGSLMLLALCFARASAAAMGEEPVAGRETVTQYLTPAVLAALFPGADGVGEVEGTPPAAAVYKGKQQVGYVFSTWDVTQSKGFSNRPLVLMVAIDLTGHVAGVRLVHHSEPIAILGLSDEALQRFSDSYKGHDINEGVDVVSELSSSVLGVGSFSQRSAPGTTASVKVDAVSRATTSSVLMSDAIVRGARVVARSRGIIGAPRGRTTARLDLDSFAPADWPALEAAGAIARLHLSYGDVRAKLAENGGARVRLGDPAAVPGDAFLDLYIALVTPAGIGINLLGDTWYDQYTAGRAIDDQIILVAASGAYSFLGDDWEHAATLDRIELVQGERTIGLTGKQIKTLPFLHAKKVPDLAERALVFLPGHGGFDPTQPWSVRLLVSGDTADKQPTFASFDLSYRLPEAYVLRGPAAAGDANGAGIGSTNSAGAVDQTLPWQAIWSAHRVKIGVLGVGLSALTAILFLEDYISRRRRLHRWIRVGFLSWTLLWLGWYAGAQLTVINLISYIHSLVSDFRWDFILADPLIAILSAFTLAAMFLWGRAAFCGWLCPFGALQELANNLAQRLHIPQFTIPIALHERLVAIKYLLFLGLVAASFLSWDLALAGAEIEPFKAAIILRFMTEWPMVAYALALIGASLFLERFYCRFACPLGGGLAIIGRVRMFDWLKRRPECGSRCRICESVCPVGAIKRTGEINMNECFYCLDCQVTYNDDHVCPPLVWARRRARQQVETKVGPAQIPAPNTPSGARR
jgi:NosR/NirI family nitrous oxide reductase transcriptional regulator